MIERFVARWRHVSACDRQMLIAAYAPVVAFGAVLIGLRTSRTRRDRLQAALR
jgi:hypothetical protein